MASMSVITTINKLCGHSDAEPIHYHTAKEREAEKHVLRKMICSQCSQKIRGMLDAPSEKPLSYSVDPLRGTAPQISWATKIRDKHKLTYGCVLMTAKERAEEGDRASLGLYRAMLALFGITDSGYWIEISKNPLNFWHFKRDAERFLMPEVERLPQKVRSQRVTGETPYEHLRRLNPGLLERIRTTSPSPIDTTLVTGHAEPFPQRAKGEMVAAVVGLMHESVPFPELIVDQLEAMRAKKYASQCMAEHHD